MKIYVDQVVRKYGQQAGKAGSRQDTHTHILVHTILQTQTNRQKARKTDRHPDGRTDSDWVTGKQKEDSVT